MRAISRTDISNSVIEFHLRELRRVSENVKCFETYIFRKHDLLLMKPIYDEVISFGPVYVHLFDCLSILSLLYSFLLTFASAGSIYFLYIKRRLAENTL
jgi:hypothetical protein